MEISRRDSLKAIASTGALALSGCLGPPSRKGGEGTDTSSLNRTEDGERVRAAFVYHDAVGDFGWQWAHEQGRRAIEEEFDWLETEIFQNFSPEGSEPRFSQIAERGFDVIFGTSWGYMDPMYRVAPDYPEVVFEHCSGYKVRDNMGRYFGRMYQPRYLTGIAAGMLTEADEIGYVAAFPISEVIRGIDAFALGVSSVNPDATVRVRYSETWNDATIESENARELLDEGVDVMAQHQNYPAAAQTAADSGIWAMGYNSPMAGHVGENYVTSPIWNWEVFYREAVQEIRNDTWEPDFYWKGLDAGIVDLSDWGPKVPKEVRDTVEEKRREILRGELDVWAGSQFEDYDEEQLFREVDSYAPNVEGDPPEAG